MVEETRVPHHEVEVPHPLETKNVPLPSEAEVSTTIEVFADGY